MTQSTTAFQKEYQDTLDKLLAENHRFESFVYFLHLAYRWYTEKPAPQVAILGPGVPEELVWASGARPYWILGGSLGSTVWSDDLVPRDTDPVSRSILGFVENPDGPDFQNTLFLIPVSSDSMRKIAYQLREENRKLFLLDIPPERGDPFAEQKAQEQLTRLTEAVSAHVKKRVTGRSLAGASRMVLAARLRLRKFLDLTSGREDLLTGTARMLVATSYYYADDLDEWTSRLLLLMEELQASMRHSPPKHSDRPGVLLMGSPAYFPNYKVPFLIEDIGLSILDAVDASTLKLGSVAALRHVQGRADRAIAVSASAWYRSDASAAYIQNDVLFEQVRKILSRGDVEGVVCHVLKGQIEYDFELARMEKMFSDAGVPVFRLETDYQYQDVEQLRIRMEAFSEMLTQNRYRKERIAR